MIGCEIMKEVLERIQLYEYYLDELQNALALDLNLNTKKYQHYYQCLASYLETLWMEDFQLDEKGCLPKDLKRGILSEDTLYNLLAEIDKKLKENA